MHTFEPGKDVQAPVVDGLPSLVDAAVATGTLGSLVFFGDGVAERVDRLGDLFEPVARRPPTQ